VVNHSIFFFFLTFSNKKFQLMNEKYFSDLKKKKVLMKIDEKVLIK